MEIENLTDQIIFKEYLHCYQTVEDEIKDYSYLNFKLVYEVFKTAFSFSCEKIYLVLLAIIIYYMVRLIVWAYWIPILIKKELTEIGYDHIPKGRDRDRKISLTQAMRRLGNKIPPPYPNGWFVVAESRELKVGSVLAVDALGQNLCVYRGEDGIARCVDAYCPHLGANLGVGGTVSGDCIQCPFHQWRFSPSGVCVSVPGIEKPPKGVSIKTWTTVEADGAVWVWFDAEGREPLWSMEDAPELRSWGYRGRNEFYVNAHIQEIPENGADVAHLNAVHTPSVLTELGERLPFLKNFIGFHIWSASWSKSEESHEAYMNLTHDYRIFKHNLGHIDVRAVQKGPGDVRLFLQTPVGPTLVVQSVTPLNPLLQKVIHRVYSPTYNAPLAVLAVKFEGDMFERDVKIWNHKMFVSAPAYVQLDKTIRTFRSWYSQFYSENSVSFRNASQNPLDW